MMSGLTQVAAGLNSVLDEDKLAEYKRNLCIMRITYFAIFIGIVTFEILCIEGSSELTYQTKLYVEVLLLPVLLAAYLFWLVTIYRLI